MFNLMIGSQYKRLEIMQIFDPEIKSHNQTGYWSMKLKNKTFYLIFCNAGISSTKINGKIFNYPNIKISNNEFIWYSRNGVSSKKNELLKNMISNPENILFFYREKGDKNGLYKFFGRIKKFEEIKATNKKESPSTYRVLRRDFSDLKLKAMDHSMVTLEYLIKNISVSNNEATGLTGEYLIHEILQNNEEGIEKIEKELGIKIDSKRIKWWYLENKRKNRDFDVHDFFIEVKTSKIDNKRFIMSDNELKLANENENKYFIVLVCGNEFEIKSWQTIKKEFKLERFGFNVFKKN